ncbi:MAG: pantoate--beta-alanine ligase [Prevotellaceae bacterium]|jgi:pantoate--beta-alanine ligase|nr:pantoate--beta-alanine ligase [Prevotellaceae bacterium]
MKTYATSKDINSHIGTLRNEGKTIGFVPTMGALHKGHLSLVELCKKDCDITVVSIFVNPTQFNDKGDLQRYPHMPETDSKLLEEAGCGILFLPGEQEIYPKPDTRVFDFGQLDKVMEGVHRPGHFNGVAQVVSRLFNIITPDKAFFGLKDFQQLAIIREMVKQLQFRVEIIAVPIVRDTDGLALSSRNMLLNEAQRKMAPLIAKTLFEAQKKAAKLSVSVVKQWVIDTVNRSSELSVEYFDIVDSLSLQPVQSWDDAGQIFGCIAVRVGNIRLIDNVRLS